MSRCVNDMVKTMTGTVIFTVLEAFLYTCIPTLHHIHHWGMRPCHAIIYDVGSKVMVHRGHATYLPANEAELQHSQQWE